MSINAGWSMVPRWRERGTVSTIASTVPRWKERGTASTIGAIAGGYRKSKPAEAALMEKITEKEKEIEVLKQRIAKLEAKIKKKG